MLGFHKLSLLVLPSITVLFANTASATEYTLDYNQWELISLPEVLPDELDTPAEVFGNAILNVNALAEYEVDWVMYSYDADAIPPYEVAPLNEPFQAGKGYWIIQAAAPISMAQVEINLPDSSVTLCQKYQELVDTDMLGDLAIPSYCQIETEGEWNYFSGGGFDNIVLLADITPSTANVEVVDLSFTGADPEMENYTEIDSLSVIASSSDGAEFKLNRNAVFITEPTCLTLTIPTYSDYAVENISLLVNDIGEDRASTFTDPLSGGVLWNNGNIYFDLRDVESNRFCINEPATAVVTYIRAKKEQFTLEIGPR